MEIKLFLEIAVMPTNGYGNEVKLFHKIFLLRLTCVHTGTPSQIWLFNTFQLSNKLEHLMKLKWLTKFFLLYFAHNQNWQILLWQIYYFAFHFGHKTWPKLPITYYKILLFLRNVIHRNAWAIFFSPISSIFRMIFFEIWFHILFHWKHTHTSLSEFIHLLRVRKWLTMSVSVFLSWQFCRSVLLFDIITIRMFVTKILKKITRELKVDSSQIFGLAKQHI